MIVYRKTLLRNTVNNVHYDLKGQDESKLSVDHLKACHSDWFRIKASINLYKWQK